MAERVWEELSRTLRSSAPYRSLLTGGGDVVRLPVPAAAWLGELLAADLKRPLLAVVPREGDALNWTEAAQLFGRRDETVYFPAPSLTPYQETATSLQVRAQEAVALDRVISGEATTVVTTPRALFRLLPTAKVFRNSVLELKPGEDWPIDELAAHLLRHGFCRTDLVYEVGDFAVRGGIFDLFPPGEGAPVRLDFFGDTIESIRGFDAQSQRSEDTLEAIRVLPLYLFPGGPEEALRLADLIAAQAGPDLDLLPEIVERLTDLRERGGFTGWENLLPLLAGSEKIASLADILPEALISAAAPPALTAEATHHAERLDADFTARREHGRLAVPPEALEQPVEAVREILERAQVRLRDL